MCGVCISAGEPGVAGEAETLAFAHVSVIPINREQILSDQTVLVAGGRIVAMGPSESTELPDGVAPIDTTDRYLIPAYCDMHRQDLIAHSEEVMKHAQGDYGQENVDRLAELIAGSGTWVIPTLVTSRNILAVFDDPERELSRPEARYFRHPMQRGMWSFILGNLYEPIPETGRQSIREGFERFQLPFTRALHDRGVRLLAGSDSPLPTLVPGFGLHRELEELVAIGLTPFEALSTSTTHPFEYLGELDDAGTIEVGKRANLVLLRENPLVDITHTQTVAGVVLEGRWLPGDQLQKEMSKLADSSGAEAGSNAR
jgi:hypothetical protein